MSVNYTKMLIDMIDDATHSSRCRCEPCRCKPCGSLCKNNRHQEVTLLEYLTKNQRTFGDESRLKEYKIQLMAESIKRERLMTEIMEAHLEVLRREARR